jgi:kynurenine formamidase
MEEVVKDATFLQQIKERGMNTPFDVICTIDALTKERDEFQKLYEELTEKILVLRSDLSISESDSKRLKKSAEWKTKAINYLIDKHIPAHNLTDGEHGHFMSLLNKADKALNDIDTEGKEG